MSVDPMTTETAAMLMRQRDEALAEIERLRDLAELACIACVPLLPLRGSAGNYEMEREIHSTLRATPQEWADAAFCVAALDKVVSSPPFPRQRANSEEDGQ